MNPLELTLEQRAALYAAARHRAHRLREQAIADAITAARRWLRKGLTPRPAASEGSVACHS